MFEKSKSAITFKEFQTKMNIVNNFDNDWGYFCDIEKLDENDNKKNKHYLKDVKFMIMNNILNCFEVIFITSIICYFIFNVI